MLSLFFIFVLSAHFLGREVPFGKQFSWGNEISLGKIQRGAFRIMSYIAFSMFRFLYFGLLKSEMKAGKKVKFWYGYKKIIEGIIVF